MFKLVLFGVILNFVASVQSELCFETVILGDLLPIPLSFFGAAFNGNDHVYLLGGKTGSIFSDRILRFALTSLQVHQVGSYGTGLAYGKGHIIGGYVAYVGGLDLDAKASIWGFSPSNPSIPKKLGDMLTDDYDVDSIYDDGHKIYTFGGRNLNGTASDSIVSLDTVELWNHVQLDARLPVPISGSSSVWANDAAYIFGGDAGGGNYSKEILRFIPPVHWEPSDPGKIEVLPQSLSVGVSGHMAVGVDHLIYVLGGHTRSGEEEHSMTRFNTLTGDIEHFHVDLGEGWANGGAIYNHWTHRIYIFGGQGNFTAPASRQIRYIQLSHNEECTLQ